jgi:hypothetical protein
MIAKGLPEGHRPRWASFKHMRRFHTLAGRARSFLTGWQTVRRRQDGRSCMSNRTKDHLAGHDQLVSVSVFDYKPKHCPFGHQLWPGMAQVGWKPCICTAAREADERARGMGHLWVSCNACHEQLWRTMFYQPPHTSGTTALSVKLV